MIFDINDQNFKDLKQEIQQIQISIVQIIYIKQQTQVYIKFLQHIQFHQMILIHQSQNINPELNDNNVSTQLNDNNFPIKINDNNLPKKDKQQMRQMILQQNENQIINNQLITKKENKNNINKHKQQLNQDNNKCIEQYKTQSDAYLLKQLLSLNIQQNDLDNNSNNKKNINPKKMDTNKIYTNRSIQQNMSRFDSYEQIEYQDILKPQPWMNNDQSIQFNPHINQNNNLFHSSLKYKTNNQYFNSSIKYNNSSIKYNNSSVKYNNSSVKYNNSSIKYNRYHPNPKNEIHTSRINNTLSKSYHIYKSTNQFYQKHHKISKNQIYTNNAYNNAQQYKKIQNQQDFQNQIYQNLNNSQLSSIQWKHKLNSLINQQLHPNFYSIYQTITVSPQKRAQLKLNHIIQKKKNSKITKILKMKTNHIDKNISLIQNQFQNNHQNTYQFKDKNIDKRKMLNSNKNLISALERLSSDNTLRKSIDRAVEVLKKRTHSLLYNKSQIKQKFTTSNSTLYCDNEIFNSSHSLLNQTSKNWLSCQKISYDFNINQTNQNKDKRNESIIRINKKMKKEKDKVISKNKILSNIQINEIQANLSNNIIQQNQGIHATKKNKIKKVNQNYDNKDKNKKGSIIETHIIDLANMLEKQRVNVIKQQCRISFRPKKQIYTQKQDIKNSNKNDKINLYLDKSSVSNDKQKNNNHLIKVNNLIKVSNVINANNLII